MEEILSSIKRVIEESEGVPGSGRSRRARSAPATETGSDDVLELSEPVSFPNVDTAAEAPETSNTPERGPDPKATVLPPPAEPAPAVESIISSTVAEASRGSLEALSRLVVKPEVAGSDTLEALVRELLRPMLRDWLDAKLPGIVETMVAKEIERISGRGL